MIPYWLSVLSTTIGLAFLASSAVSVVNFVRLYTRPSNLQRYLHATGGKPAWALVTGSSDGIGRFLAFELAARGFHVVLHGRNAAKLEGVREALEKAHPSCRTRTVVYDAARCVRDGPDSLQQAFVRAVEDVNLTVLINNAGGGTRPRAFGTLDSFDKDTIIDNSAVNAMFPTLLAAALIPELLRNGPGLLINISSLAAGLPLVTFYGAAKAYVNGLTLALAREMDMEGRGIEVMAQRLGRFTTTSLNKDPPAFFSPSADTAARAILDRVGCGCKEVIPYWGHAIQALGLNGFVPEALIDKVMISIMRRERANELSKAKKQ